MVTLGGPQGGSHTLSLAGSPASVVGPSQIYYSVSTVASCRKFSSL